MKQTPQPKAICRFAILGNASIGKSCLVSSFGEGFVWSAAAKPLVSGDFAQRMVNVPDCTRVGRLSRMHRLVALAMGRHERLGAESCVRYARRRCAMCTEEE